jgi:hypothetical protein
MRERLDEAKALLTDLHQRVQTYTGPFELPEPDDELGGVVERLAEREMQNVPTRLRPRCPSDGLRSLTCLRHGEARRSPLG